MKPKRPRLKKGPGIDDYVVEVINRSFADRNITTYSYFYERKDARAFAKSQHVRGVRVRIFRIKYQLVEDLK